MLLVSISGIVFVGSFVSSALSFARSGYSARKAQKDRESFGALVDGSEKFISERYIQLRNELASAKEAD